MLAAIVRLFARSGGSGAPVAVSSLMKHDPVVVGPETSSLDALRLMRDRKSGCLPVVENGRLVGIVTESDFIKVAEGLLEERLRAD